MEYYADKYGGAPTSYGDKCGGCKPGYECITTPGWGGYGQESPDTHECKPTAETRARWAEERKAANAKAAAEKKAALNAIAENTGSANALLANTKYTNWYDRQYGVAIANIGTIRSRLYNSGNKDWLKYTNAQWKEVAGKVRQTRKAKANANTAKAAANAAARKAKANANAAKAAANAAARKAKAEADAKVQAIIAYKQMFDGWESLIHSVEHPIDSKGAPIKSYIEYPQDQGMSLSIRKVSDFDTEYGGKYEPVLALLNAPLSDEALNAMNAAQINAKTQELTRVIKNEFIDNLDAKPVYDKANPTCVANYTGRHGRLMRALMLNKTSKGEPIRYKREDGQIGVITGPQCGGGRRRRSTRRRRGRRSHRRRRSTTRA